LYVAFSLGFIISAGGAFLKPIVIAKGKTKNCLKKYCLDNNFTGTFTKSGWADDECIKLVLDNIYSITKNQKGILLLDQYPSHTTDKVKEYAKNKNIELIYVPKGMTYKYQPLDTTINAIIKQKAIKSYAEFIAENNNEKYTHANCLKDLITNIKTIKKGVIIRAFDCLDRSKNGVGK
jgi:hypothetical protein